jgi:hypothetical protein
VLLGLAPVLSSLGPSCGQAPAGIGPVAGPLSVPSPWPCFLLLPRRSAGSHRKEGAFCKPEADPFLLLESSLKAIERILQLRRGLPLRRTWIAQPYGEEEITLLEEEVIPAIQQELLQRCQLEADREALGDLRLQMA